jgi:hypothetical protein
MAARHPVARCRVAAVHGHWLGSHGHHARSGLAPKRRPMPMVRGAGGGHWLVVRVRGCHWLVVRVWGCHWLVVRVRGCHWLVGEERNGSRQDLALGLGLGGLGKGGMGPGRVGRGRLAAGVRDGGCGRGAPSRAAALRQQGDIGKGGMEYRTVSNHIVSPLRQVKTYLLRRARDGWHGGLGRGGGAGAAPARVKLEVGHEGVGRGPDSHEHVAQVLQMAGASGCDVIMVALYHRQWASGNTRRSRP